VVARRDRLGAFDAVIVAYTEIPAEAGGVPRPLVDLAIADMDELRYPCLVDSGAVNTLLPGWLAEAAAVDLAGADRRTVAVAATGAEAAFTTIRLSTIDHSWEAEVGFCDPWPYAWGLAGQRSFFRFFTVTFRAVDFEFELTPVRP
jgi:hypothetical protein